MGDGVGQVTGGGVHLEEGIAIRGHGGGGQQVSSPGHINSPRWK
ncbi:hypothetical protein ACG98H_11790 [Corynebacterium sp. L4756]